jgi:hypothetical protein
MFQKVSGILPYFSCEPVIAGDMLYEQRAGIAFNELHPESIQSGKGRFGRRNQRYLSSSVHITEKRSI